MTNASVLLSKVSQVHLSYGTIVFFTYLWSGHFRWTNTCENEWYPNQLVTGSRDHKYNKLCSYLGQHRITHKVAAKDSSYEILVINPRHVHLFGAFLVHGQSVRWYSFDPGPIAVWSQLRINSDGISSISYLDKTWFRNISFNCERAALACLLLAVVTFLSTKFTQFMSEYVQSLVSSTWPPNSRSLDWSQDRRMPLAAAIAILAETTCPSPPTPLSYCWTILSQSSPRRNGLPQFFRRQWCHIAIMLCCSFLFHQL